MKLMAVNGSPRKNWNTGQLLEHLVEGARSAGAEAELVHLIDYRYTGCMSCFSCMLKGGRSYGRCAQKDELAPILDRAHEADVLVLGSPIYFGTETGIMRSFEERLWFQYLLYSNVKPPVSPRKKATALVFTMNVKKEENPKYGQDVIMNKAKYQMERFFGPCEVLVCADTLQVDDYSKYEMDRWDAEAKHRRHNEVFPQELEQAFALGARLVS